MTVKEQLKAKQDMEPFDEVLYESENECPTCKIEKTARSKHCAVCDECVAHFDHHCVWINGCITSSNLSAFILYLFVHLIFVSYSGGIYIAACVTSMKIDGREMFHDMRRARSDPDGFYVGILRLWSKFSLDRLRQV